MTEEAKVEAEATTEAVEEAPAPLSPEEKHKELQGKKKTHKKKVKYYNKTECLEELQRLERVGHQHSKYYKDVKAHALSL